MILESAVVLMRSQIRFKISFVYMQEVNFIFKNLLQIVFFFSLSLCHASVNPPLHPPLISPLRSTVVYLYGVVNSMSR